MSKTLTSNESSKSYAIFARSSYGDLLMTDPLIKYIKNINVNNKITLFADMLNITNVPHVYFMGDASKPVEKEVYGSTIKIGTNYRF